MTDERATRVPYITSREHVPADLRHNFDSVAESRGGVRGPFCVLMNSPEVAGRAGHLGAYVRFEGELQGMDRELTILATSREFDCPYEWSAHEPLAREEGVSEEAIETVATRGSLDDLAETEALVVRYVRELLGENRVSDETFTAAHERFGTKGVTELTATIGYYGMLAAALNAFEVMPDGGTPASW